MIVEERSPHDPAILTSLADEGYILQGDALAVRQCNRQSGTRDGAFKQHGQPLKSAAGTRCGIGDRAAVVFCRVGRANRHAGGDRARRLKAVQMPLDLAQVLGAGDALFSTLADENHGGTVVNGAPAADGSWELLAVIPENCASGGPVHAGGPDGPVLELLPLPY